MRTGWPSMTPLPRCWRVPSASGRPILVLPGSISIIKAVRATAVGGKRAAAPHAFPFCDERERGLVMPVRKMRAALTAIFLGTAVAGTAVLAMGLPAQALTVSAKVGPLLNEAKALFSAGKYD